MTLMHSRATLTVGMVLFPNLTQLDLTGPYEVFSRMPDTVVHVVASAAEPIRTEHGLTIVPDATFESAPTADIICVPGGVGVNAAMEDGAVLEFLRLQSHQARYVTSVCTGALVLGAAGLLRGYKATTHWLSLDLLPLLGAHAVNERVVIDRDRITGGGVTAGIDFGLVVASELFGPAVAHEIQLLLEYNPTPPFSSGSPETAPAHMVENVVRSRKRVQSERRAIVERAAKRLTQVGKNLGTISAAG
jgi:cyclohexyl-isocyanide hydratase